MEVAARNQLLKERGYDAARRFAERVDEMIDADASARRPRVAAPPGAGPRAAPARAGAPAGAAPDAGRRGAR